MKKKQGEKQDEEKEKVCKLLSETTKYVFMFHKENPARRNGISKFIIQYLCEAQHVLGDTPPIIRYLKLH